MVYMIDFEKSRALMELPFTGVSAVDTKQFWPTGDLGKTLRARRPPECPKGILSDIAKMSGRNITDIIRPVAEDLNRPDWFPDSVAVLVRRGRQIGKLVKEVLVDKVNNQIGRYWAIFYQPLPESGERIAIALVLDHNSADCTVEFDEKFAKVRKVFPDLDAEGMAFTLSGLQTKLNETHNRDFLLASLGPQISASTARRAALPFTDKRKASLMSRYVLPAKSTRPEPLTAQEQRNQTVTKAIQGYIRGYFDGKDISVEVSPKQIVGRNIPGVRPVAIGIRAGDGSWTVMDGVDLNQSTAQSAERRADDIGHTYWKLKREAERKGIKVKSIGIVLNGHSHLSPRSKEAHDYALLRFQQNSDHAVDAAEGERNTELQAFIEPLLIES